MAVLSKLICLGAALLSSSAYAAPLQERDSCDFGIADPAGWQSVFTSTWCGMVNNEVAGLKSKEDATTMIPNLEAIFKQANIKIAPSSALPDVNKIMADPMAKAAMKQMKANFPAFGSMDLTPENIQTVYADAIKNACSKTGVPEDIMVKIIWTESKGHPLVYQGLTQMDYVAWGQMADEDSSLKNRYMPADNILASAMYLKKMNGQYGGDYATTYTQHYQDPSAKDRAQ